MVNPLIPIHVLTGLGGVLLPLWIALEMLKPANEVLLRAIRAVAAFSLILIVASWVTGGLYYVNVYGPEVKPAIKATQPWIHYIVMESKEHLFLFMPFLAALLNVLVWGNLERTRRMVSTVAIALVILGLLMTITGLPISGAREAAGVIL